MIRSESLHRYEYKVVKGNLIISPYLHPSYQENEKYSKQLRALHPVNKQTAHSLITFLLQLVYTMSDV